MAGYDISFDQALPSLGKYDAIGNEVRLIRDILREEGFDSEIYVESKQVPKEANSIFKMKPNPKGHFILYHFSTGSNVPYFLIDKRYTIISRFHNITPSDFFHPIAEPGPYDACLKGRLQIPLIKALSDHIISASEFNRDTLGGNQKQSVVPVLRNYSQLAEYKFETKIKKERPILLFVGRLTRHKSVHHLVYLRYALQKYLGLDTQLYLIGHNDLHFATDELTNIIESLGESVKWNASKVENYSQNIVHFAGLSEKALAEAYKISDVFITLSDHEGFCVPLVEAMFFDLPIVANCKAAIPETMGDSGIVFDRRDIKNAMLVLKEILTNQDLRSSIIESQRDQRKRFDFGQIKEQFRGLIHEVIRSHRSQLH